MHKILGRVALIALGALSLGALPRPRTDAIQFSRSGSQFWSYSRALTTATRPINVSTGTVTPALFVQGTMAVVQSLDGDSACCWTMTTSVTVNPTTLVVTDTGGGQKSGIGNCFRVAQNDRWTGVSPSLTDLTAQDNEAVSLAALQPGGFRTGFCLGNDGSGQDWDAPSYIWGTQTLSQARSAPCRVAGDCTDAATGSVCIDCSPGIPVTNCGGSQSTSARRYNELRQKSGNFLVCTARATSVITVWTER